MMTPMPAWDRTNQMPGERPFEAYHMRDTTAQPRIIHSHEFYEIYFFVSGRIRIVTEEVDVCPRRGDVLVFPPHCMHRNIHLSAEEPYERFYLYASRAFVQSITGCGAELSACLDTLVQEGLLLPGELEGIQWSREDTRVDFGLIYDSRNETEPDASKQFNEKSGSKGQYFDSGYELADFFFEK